METDNNPDQNKPGDVIQPGAQPGDTQEKMVSEAVQTPAPQTETPQSSKFKINKDKIKLFLIIIGVTILVFTAGAVAYLGLYLPSQPEYKLAIALDNSLNEDSVAYKLETKVTGAAEGKDTTIVDASGATDKEGNSQGSLSVDFTLFKFNLGLRTTPTQVYIKAGGLKNISTLLSAGGFGAGATSQVETILDSLNNQWIEIDLDMLSAFGVDSDDSLALTQTQIDQFKSAMRSHFFLNVDEVLPDTNVNGTDVMHYKVSIDPNELVAFVRALDDFKFLGMGIDETQLSAFEASLSQQNLNTGMFFVYIDKQNNRIHRIEMTGKSGDSDMTTTIDLTDYGQPVNVVPPKKTKPLLEILGNFSDLFGGSGLFSGDNSAFFGSQLSNRDNERQTDVNIIATQVEIYGDLKEHYPTVKQMGSTKWVEQNLPGLDTASLKDPSGDKYVYKATNDDDKPCGDKAATCENFSVSADLEQDGRGKKDKDRNTADYVKTN